MTTRRWSLVITLLVITFLPPLFGAIGVWEIFFWMVVVALLLILFFTWAKPERSSP